VAEAVGGVVAGALEPGPTGHSEEHHGGDRHQRGPLPLVPGLTDHPLDGRLADAAGRLRGRGRVGDGRPCGAGLARATGGGHGEATEAGRLDVRGGQRIDLELHLGAAGAKLDDVTWRERHTADDAHLVEEGAVPAVEIGEREPDRVVRIAQDAGVLPADEIVLVGIESHLGDRVAAEGQFREVGERELLARSGL